VSLDELINYCKQKEVNIPIETVIDMFNHAAKYRKVTNSKQYNDPLNIKEIQLSVRGRHRFNPEKKEWEIYYKPYRNYWIILLLTVQDKLFAN